MAGLFAARMGAGSAFQCGGAVGGGACDSAADDLAELEDEGHLDGVDGAVAVLPAGDDADGEQAGELLGDVGLLEAGAVDEFADAPGAGLQRLQDAEATALREHGEEFGDGCELGGLEGFVRGLAGWGGLLHGWCPACKLHVRPGLKPMLDIGSCPTAEAVGLIPKTNSLKPISQNQFPKTSIPKASIPKINIPKINIPKTNIPKTNIQNQSERCHCMDQLDYITI